MAGVEKAPDGGVALLPLPIGVALPPGVESQSMAGARKSAMRELRVAFSSFLRATGARKSNRMMELLIVSSGRGIKDPSKTTYYCDIPLGVYVIRGDSVVLLGNMDDQKVANLKEISLDELQQKEEEAADAAPESQSGPLTWDFDADLIA